jgi:hypothetical protein
MNKKESYRERLSDLVSEFLRTGDPEKLREYLVSNSNLPGPRGNLELADVFAEIIENYSNTDSVKIWDFCLKLAQYSVAEAPTNSPEEFLVFCGARGIGIFGSSPDYFGKALSCLKELAEDPRWRTREGVAMALQSMIKREPQKALRALEGWIENENWLVMRAVAAAVAEPLLLKNKETGESALDLHKKIFFRIFAAKERSPDFKVLRQGLGYSLSVVISEVPDEGFRYMHQLAESQDADMLWIVKENLKKKRLTKYPNEVGPIMRLLHERGATA